MALDAMGHEAWRTQAQQRRSIHANQQSTADDDYEVEEEELDRLMAGLTQAAVQEDMPQELDDAVAATRAERAQLVNDQFRDEIMRGSGFKKQRRGLKKMRRPVPEQAFSHEVQSIMRDANLLYVEERLHEAIEKFQEVIRIEPTARKAWAYLATCNEELGLTEKSIQAKIIEATLTPRATDLWIQLAQSSSNARLNRQAVYCFEQAIKTSTEKDKSDVLDVMWDRAVLLRQIGDTVKATEAFNQLLRLRPHSNEVLNNLIPLFIQRGQTLRAIKVLEQARDFNFSHFPDPTTGDAAHLATYLFSEVATLADLLLMNQEPVAALHAVRQGARWLQGRASETFWDQVVEDDREFDQSREADSRPGAISYGRRVEMAPVYEPLDVQLRLRLGFARAKIGDINEAQRHFDIYLAAADPDEFSEQFEEVADVQMELNQWEHALDVLMRMIEVDKLKFEPRLYGKIGICHQCLGSLQEAANCFEPIIEADSYNLEIKIRLAEVYEDLQRRPEAIRLVNEVMHAREEIARAKGMEPSASGAAAAAAATTEGSTPDDPTTSVRATLSLFDEYSGTGTGAADATTAQRKQTGRAGGPQPRRRRPAMDIAQRRRLEQAREEETRLMFQRLQARETAVFVPGWWRSDVELGGAQGRPRYGIHSLGGAEGIDRDVHVNAVESWLDAASRLVESFRSISQLFPRKRSARRAYSGGVGATTANSEGAMWSRRRRTGQNRRSGKGGQGDSLGNQAAELLSRIQDDIVNEGARHDESSAGGGTASSSSTAPAEKHEQYWLETTFRGVDFDQWVDLFMKYAFLQTKMGDYTAASEMLSHVRVSYAALHNERRQLAISLCAASCALYARDYEGTFEALRVLPFTWQFNNTPLRILSSVSHATGFYGLDWFSEGRLAKMLLRRMRIHEAIASGMPYEFSQIQNRYVVKDKMTTSRRHRQLKGTGGSAGRPASSQRGAEDDSGQEEEESDEDEDEDEDMDEDADEGQERARDDTPTSSIASKIRNEGSTSRPVSHSNSPAPGSASTGSTSAITSARREKAPTRSNPMGELFYAYYLLAAGSYQAALAYVLRAYARAPTDPLICLVVAIACFGRMTNRQTDNRHHLFLQGLSFLSRYRQLRCDEGARGVAWMEATYNFGRSLHSLGLFSMAVPQYESVLRAHDALQEKQRGQKKDTAGMDCYREAAWNLGLILSINGDTRAARGLMRKYLAVPL